MEFPDKKSMPVVLDGMRELLKGFEYYMAEIGKVSDMGDLEIFCFLVSTVFINGCRDFIERVRYERNDPPKQGLNAYLSCIEKLRNQVIDEKVLNCFEYPPEEWLDNATRV